MTSSNRSSPSPPAWGATVPRPRALRAGLAGAWIAATFLVAWTFLVLAVAAPAARLGRERPRPPPAAERLAAAPERR